jgi:hypothetical protein
VRDPATLSLLETPEPGDVITLYNTADKSVFAWMKGNQAWEDVTDSFLNDKGTVCHPGWPMSQARILSWRNDKERIPTYVLLSTWKKKKRPSAGFRIRASGGEDNEEEEEEEAGKS